MFGQSPIFSQSSERPLAHCATVTALPDDTLVAAWFSGTFEGATDMVIMASRYQDSTWSAPETIVEAPGHALGQPVFLTRPDGELWLFFVIVMETLTETGRSFNALPPLAAWLSAQPYMQRSLDGGRTWSEPVQVMDYPGLMFRSRPLVLPDRIIMPVYDETTWESRMMISKDDGHTWNLTAPMTTPDGNIHPCVVPLSDGRLLAYLRTGGKGGVIWRTESQDRGDTWTQPTATRLPNPNSGIDLLKLQSGALVLAYNNNDRLRTPLCVALAEEDEGWHWQQTLADGAGEFSYPTLIQSNDGLIHIVYTYRREHIHHASFSEAWLRESKKEHESEH